MKNQTSLLRWASVFALALVVCVSAGHSARGATDAASAAGEKRADVVTIDAMAEDGKLELPAVTFLHDQHTKALASMQKDCSACHKPLKDKGEGRYSFHFMGSDTVKGDALKTLYHSKCIGCHTDLRKEGKKTGPQEAECRSCHQPRPAVVDDWRDIGLDKVVHNKHVQSKQILVEGQDKNCAACHHVYDAAEQKLAWGKNKEDSCRACHLLPEDRNPLEAQAAVVGAQQPADENGPLLKRPSLDKAAHQACVNCHLINISADGMLKTGPTDCAGCHGAPALAKLAEESAKVDPKSVPRLERGQDDAVLMLPVAEKSKDLISSMNPVSFNHKYHEAVAMDCRSCHHKKIAACGDCHTLEGKAEGNNVQLYRAMHLTSATRSCVGCHLAETQQPSCAGCHTTIPEKLSQNSCKSCHSTPVGVSEQEATNASLLKLDKDGRKALADATVAEREKRSVAVVAQDDIPDKVTIGVLSNEYQPSELPHRKIVNTLVDKQKDNRMAAVFHSEETTLCQGCHLYSPASKTPPRCVSCHAVAVTAESEGHLNLRAAYHQQCMTCHERMNQKPAATECADCHKVRVN